MKLLFENWRRYLNEQQDNIHIFFDMDGVLVNFAGKVAEEINKTLHENPDELYPPPGLKSSRRALRRLQGAFAEENRTEPVTAEELESMTAKKDAGGERTKVEKRISDYLFSIISNNPEVWRDMGILSGAKEMVELAKQVGEVYILTSPVDEASEDGKRQWLAKHFPDIEPGKIFVTKEKGEKLQSLGIVERGEQAFLIDDRAKYIVQFEGAGGVGVPHSEKAVSKTINFLRSLIA